MIPIGETEIDEWTVQWYQPLILETLMCFNNDTNYMEEFTRRINDMLFPRQFIVN